MLFLIKKPFLCALCVFARTFFISVKVCYIVDFTMISSGTDYHLHTGYDRRKLSGHFLDWANQSDIYKEYSQTEKVMLSRDVSIPNEKFSQIIGKTHSEIRPENLSLEQISRIFAAFFTKFCKKIASESILSVIDKNAL